jgi:hypothetical protein
MFRCSQTIPAANEVYTHVLQAAALCRTDISQQETHSTGTEGGGGPRPAQLSSISCYPIAQAIRHTRPMSRRRHERGAFLSHFPPPLPRPPRTPAGLVSTGTDREANVSGTVPSLLRSRVRCVAWRQFTSRQCKCVLEQMTE